MEEKIFCSRCKDPMSRIVYGYPTEALLEIAAEKGWIIGGCMPTPLSQYCKKCKVSWSEDLGFDKSAL